MSDIFISTSYINNLIQVADNIDILMQQDDIDGVLVGGAALKAESFERIICFQ